MKYCKPFLAMLSAAAIAVAVPLYAPCDSPSDARVTITATTAAVPSIDGPDQVDPGKPAWYRVSGIPDGASVAFLPTPLLDTAPSRIVQGNAMFWVGRPGEYTITALVVDWNAKTFVPVVKQITVGQGDSPNPPIPPVPPVPGDRWVVIVSETNRPTVEHRQLLTELRTSNQFPRLWIVDPDPARADPAVAPYLSGLDAAKPQIIIIGEDKDKAGVVLYRGDCPATAADVAALLKRYGG